MGHIKGHYDPAPSVVQCKTDHNGPTLAQNMTLTYARLSGDVAISIINRNAGGLNSMFQFRIQNTQLWFGEGDLEIIKLATLEDEGGSMIIQVRVHIFNPGDISTIATADIQAWSQTDGLIATANMKVNIIGCTQEGYEGILAQCIRC